MRHVKADDYDDMAESFRGRLREQALKPMAEQVFPEDHEWLAVDVIATCRTKGCVNEGIGFECQPKENADEIYRVYCGKCGHQMADVVPHFADGPAAKLPTNPVMAAARQKARAKRLATAAREADL